MTKSHKVRRFMAKAKINGMDRETMILKIMKSCDITRSVATAYICKNEGSALLRDLIKEMRAKQANKTAAPAKVKTPKVKAPKADEPVVKRPRGRPRKVQPAPVQEETATVVDIFGKVNTDTVQALTEVALAA